MAVEEEEEEHFPKIKKGLDEDGLIALAQEMMLMATELEGTNPRKTVPAETSSVPAI